MRCSGEKTSDPVYETVPPDVGEKITVTNGKLNTPDRPIIPFIEGYGTGPDIWRASKRVFDAAVEKAFGGSRKIVWFEVYAGEKANTVYGPNTWLHDDTLQAIKDHVIAIKGPLTTPVGGGIRSINVALRQTLDLYVCLRPVRYFNGVPSPVKHPELVNMAIFRENTEDIYAGIEWKAGTPEVQKVIDWLQKDMGVKKIRFPESSSIGIAPGGNINFENGYAVFEATHGTAPKYANQDKVNPGSLILSGEMMLRYMGWKEAADLIIKGLEKTIESKVVTYDFARLMENATEVKCSEFAETIVKNMYPLCALLRGIRQNAGCLLCSLPFIQTAPCLP